jgi:hypothetical protein
MPSRQPYPAIQSQHLMLSFDCWWCAGVYCPDPAKEVGCPAGSYCSEGSTTPEACPAGSYCMANSSAPVRCPAGTVNPLQQQSSFSAGCTWCVNGSFSEHSGSPACQSCAPDAYCPRGSTEATGSSFVVETIRAQLNQLPSANLHHVSNIMKAFLSKTVGASQIASGLQQLSSSQLDVIYRLVSQFVQCDGFPTSGRHLLQAVPALRFAELRPAQPPA